MDKKEIEFEFQRTMKNTYSFHEKSSESLMIGTLYVQKSVFSSKDPMELKVPGGLGVEDEREDSYERYH